MSVRKKCKVCNTPFKSEIEKRLLKGDPTAMISQWLLAEGETISGTSIQRHRDNHFGPTKTDNVDSIRWDAQHLPDDAPPVDQPLNSGPVFDIDRTMDQLGVDPDSDDPIQTTRELLDNIVKNQLLIVHGLQNQYIEGTCAYPGAQILGLRNVITTLKDVATIAREERESVEKQKMLQHIIDNADDSDLEILSFL